ncbi:unnamed protein product [Cochlearia groenlandica]
MDMRNVNNFFVALFVSAVLVGSAAAATMESPAPSPGASSATVAFPVVGSIVAASLSAFLAILLQRKLRSLYEQKFRPEPVNRPEMEVENVTVGSYYKCEIQEACGCYWLHHQVHYY